MNCNFNRTLLQEYLDGETGTLENLLLEEHLRACPGCRSEMEELLFLFREMDNLPKIDPPEDLAVLRKTAINSYLDADTGISAGAGKSITTSGANLGSILSAIWQGQAVWANQTVNFVRLLPTEGKSARNASEIIKKSGRMAGRAMFATAKKLAAAASRRA